MKTIPTELVPYLNDFLTKVNTAINKTWKYTHNVAPIVKVHSIGARYAKLTKYERRGADGNFTWETSGVYCFVDITNGNILKGSWKAPVADGVRGNLKDADVLQKVTTYGVEYIGAGTGGTIWADLKKLGLL